MGEETVSIPAMAQLQLRPYSLGGLIDASFTTYRRRFGPMIAVALALGLIPIVVSLVGGCSTEMMGQTTCTSPIGWLGNIAFQVATFVASAATIMIAAGAYVDFPSDWRQVTSIGLRRIVPIVVLTLLLVVTIIIGVFLLVFPGLFLAVSFAVAMSALMIEKSGPLASLGRSWRLVSGERWRIFGAFLVLIIVMIIALGIVWGIVFWVLSGVLGMSGAVAQHLAQQIVSLLAVPMSAAFGAALYLDLRVRKENLDADELVSLLSRER